MHMFKFGAPVRFSRKIGSCKIFIKAELSVSGHISHPKNLIEKYM